MTTLRFFLVMFTGSILYFILLYLLRYYDRLYIKPRTGFLKTKPRNIREGIILTYLIVLFLIIILSFVIIKLNIRAAK